jgi:periplasmic protein TonB
MNRSVDWLLIGLLFVSAALHAGLFAILNDWKHPRPPLAMPAIRIALSAPSPQNSTAAPSRTGRPPSEGTENTALQKPPRPSPAQAPTPPLPSRQSVQSSRPKIPLPVIRMIAPPPALHLASAPTPTPKLKPLRKPKPSPGPAARSHSQPASAPEAAPTPEAKAASPKRVKPGPGEHAGMSSAAARREAGAHPTGQSRPGPDLNRYLHRIVQRIEAKKHYPFRARTRRIEGRATVVFRISPQGGLLNSHVVTHSGHDILDRAALKAVNEAAPFPKPPRRFRGKPISLEVVLVFSLDSVDTR